MSASTRRESLSDPANDILLMKRIFSDIAFTALLLAAATGLSFCFFHFGNKNPANITVIYILALILIALKTNGYLYGIATALFCVVAVNYFFSYPYFRINFSLDGYPLNFIGMLAISLITSATTTTLKRQRLAIAEREKKLAEADREKLRANLLRAVSHDLRTPLTSIIGSSSSYLENYRCLTDADRLELVSNIKEDSEWLLNMVENLLTVTRINDSADNKVKKSSEVVEEVVSEAIQRLQKRLPDIRIRVSMPSDFLMLPMDPTLIEQVLINLIENAVIHSGSTEPVDQTISSARQKISSPLQCAITEKALTVPFSLTSSKGSSSLPNPKQTVAAGWGSACRSAGRSSRLTEEPSAQKIWKQVRNLLLLFLKKRRTDLPCLNLQS